MTKNYQYAVYIGRFQVFHAGHLAVLNQAIESADHVVVVLGSHDAPRSPKNPFTSAERQAMILSCLPPGLHANLSFVTQEDHYYDNLRWQTEVAARVTNVVMQRWQAGPLKIALIGYEKDASSAYQSWFSDWDRIRAPAFGNSLDATRLRREFFLGGLTGVLSNASLLPPGAGRFLRAFIKSPHYPRLATEAWALYKSKTQWDRAPYPPKMVCADPVITHRGRVLLIERGGDIGKGLLAFPGGHINEWEEPMPAALRELREETGLTLDADYAIDFLEGIFHATAPRRSQQHRVISFVYHFAIDDDDEAPWINPAGGDDAAAAMWVPLSEVRRDRMFDDHFDILEELNLLPVADQLEIAA